MAHQSLIETSGAKLEVLKRVGEGWSTPRIRDWLAAEGFCDLSRQSVWNWIANQRKDPEMREAISLSATMEREGAADLVTSTVAEQLDGFRRLVTIILGKFETLLEECDGNLSEAFPIRDTETTDDFQARMVATEAMFKNVTKLDDRLEKWTKLMGQLQGVKAFETPGGLLPSGSIGGDVNIQVNIGQVVQQYQALMVDFVHDLPDQKRGVFMKRLKAIELTE